MGLLKKAVVRASSSYPFGTDDFVQQVLGSALLTAPFIFTEEVWSIAADTTPIQSGATILLTLALGHGVLYVSSRERDWDDERKLFGVTYRYISLMIVSFSSIGLLMLLTGVLATFNATLSQAIKVVIMVSIFSVIGAATADNLI